MGPTRVTSLNWVSCSVVDKIIDVARICRGVPIPIFALLFSLITYFHTFFCSSCSFNYLLVIKIVPNSFTFSGTTCHAVSTFISLSIGIHKLLGQALPPFPPPKVSTSIFTFAQAYTIIQTVHILFVKPILRQTFVRSNLNTISAHTQWKITTFSIIIHWTFHPERSATKVNAVSKLNGTLQRNLIIVSKEGKRSIKGNLEVRG